MPRRLILLDITILVLSSPAYSNDNAGFIYGTITLQNGDRHTGFLHWDPEQGFWNILSCIWTDWRRPGRPKVSREVRELIRQMSMASPMWGAPRIHGELLNPGIDISQATVSKDMA